MPSNIQQLSLFVDPREELCMEAFLEMCQQEWYQNKLHRWFDGGGLWHHLHIKGIEDIELDYCRAWIRAQFALGNPLIEGIG